ncbi:MAG: tetratricopeptide repeat protein, partial [Parvularculaceae bacterium]
LKAAVFLKLHNAAGAVDLAKRSLALDPLNTEAVAVIATERAQAGDQEGALAEVDAALSRTPETAIFHLLRLQLLANLGRTNEMAAGYRNLIDVHPDVVAYRQLLVGYLMREKDFQAARKELEEIVRLSPGKIEPILDVARLDYRVDGVEAAKNTFKAYAEAAPDNIDLQLAFAGYLRQQDELSGAEAIYNALASRKKDTKTVLRARNELAALRLIEGKKDEAAAIVEEILSADKSNAEALLTRAGLKIDSGSFDDAITDLRSVLVDKPESLQAKMLMAAAFEMKGDVEFATSQLAQAVEESKKASAPSNIFAKFLMRHDDAPRAERVLIDTLAAHPGNLENLKLLAALQLMQQNWRGAEETAKLIETLSEEEPAVSSILGAAYAGLGDYSGAIEALSEANTRSPLAARPLATLVAAYLKDNRAAEAEEMLRSMIAADGKNYLARLLLAQVELAGDRRDDAEKTFLAAIVAEPKRGEAREGLYRLYRATGRSEEAGRVIDDGIAAAPESDGMRMLKADFLLSRSDKEGALAIYGDVLTRRPGDLLASNNFASLTNELRDDSQSRAKALEVARALEGQENPFFLDTLGWALHLSGDHAGAVKALEAAAQGAPNHPEIAYHLGAAYLAAGEPEKGRAQLEKVLNAGDTPFRDRANELLAQN